MPEKKEPPYLIIFLLLSLLLHLGLAYRYRAWEPAGKALEELRKKRNKDIPVQIIELPPKKKKPETPKPPPKKPSFLADRNQQTKTETRTEKSAPKTKIVTKPVKPQPKPKPKPAAPPKPKADPRPQEKSKPQTKPQAKPKNPPVKDNSSLTKAQPPSKKPEKLSPPEKKGPKKRQPDIKKLFPSADELLKYTEERQRRPAPSGKQQLRLPNKLKRGTEISLNTLDYKFHSYYLALKRKIELVWEYPYKARQTGAQGRLQMRFVINQDGSLAEIKILHSSGVAILDHEAVRAIQNASPFPPLPERMHTERLAVTATFEYLLSYRSVH
ncbi:MAG: energy transducer TonB [Pseudomonadota bacterium]|nr:energy transducer TonB [Pseudomonadota bacterium]